MLISKSAAQVLRFWKCNCYHYSLRGRILSNMKHCKKFIATVETQNTQHYTLFVGCKEAFDTATTPIMVIWVVHDKATIDSSELVCSLS